MLLEREEPTRKKRKASGRRTGFARQNLDIPNRLRRVQSMPGGAALGRLMRIARVGVAIVKSFGRSRSGGLPKVFMKHIAPLLSPGRATPLSAWD